MSQDDNEEEQRRLAVVLIDKSIEFKASVSHCLWRPSSGFVSELKKCDKPSFEQQLWATLVHYGSPTTILSTDKTKAAAIWALMMMSESLGLEL